MCRLFDGQIVCFYFVVAQCWMIVNWKVKKVKNENTSTPNGLDNKKVDNDGEAIEEKTEDNWIVPKHVPTDYFCTKHRNAEEKKERRNNNRHELSQYNDEDERHGEEKESESVEVNKRKNKKGNERN